MNNKLELKMSTRMSFDAAGLSDMVLEVFSTPTSAGLTGVECNCIMSGNGITRFAYSEQIDTPATNINEFVCDCINNQNYSSEKSVLEDIANAFLTLYDNESMEQDYKISIDPTSQCITALSYSRIKHETVRFSFEE